MCHHIVRTGAPSVYLSRNLRPVRNYYRVDSWLLNIEFKSLELKAIIDRGLTEKRKR